MSWIQKLYETYENCETEIGKIEDENQIPLLPICHTTQKAQVEIVIDQNGNFKKARAVQKENARTIIPCTEHSAGRTRDLEPHPLSDKLQYIAIDYTQYGGDKKSGYEKYLKLIEGWCNSEFKHPKAILVNKYIQQGNVIRDLVDHKIMFFGDNRKLLKKWEKKGEKEKPTIFYLFQGGGWQADAFVRWEVEIPDDPSSKTWRDKSLRESWIKYYTTTKKDETLCYATGKKLLKTHKQPRKIRGDGDGAKLISSNDNVGFTFLGRFTSADQACGIGFEITQKAHNALRWLVAKQGTIFYVKGDSGKINPGLTIVAWAISGKKIPDPMSDTLGLFEDEETRSQIMSTVSTAQNLANNLSKLIAGYNARLDHTEGIIVMAMDSATPGRMSITYYRELTGSDFIERVMNWHKSCAWWQDFGKDKDTNKPIRFVGAPAAKDIAWATYGRRIDDKLRKATVERILPCIVDGAPLPLDIVQSAVRHTSNRIGLDNWEWEKALGITCSVYKHFHKERRYEMALETERHTRDYLFGRLLAAADCLEGLALFLAKEKRETCAARLMQRFADLPCSTWKTIELSLSPYKARLGARAAKYQKAIDEVMCAFNTEDFISDKPLTGEFLLGYHCQRRDLWPGGQDSGEPNDEETVFEQSN